MKIIYTLLLTLCPLLSLATGQEMDILKFDGEDYNISIFPLEDSPIRNTELPKFPLPENYKLPIQLCTNTNGWRSTGNYRGYVATWEIEDKKLYLTGIKGWIAEPHSVFKDNPDHDDPKRVIASMEYTYRKAALDALFPHQVKDGRVLADWYSGELFTGGWHPGIKRSAEMLGKQKQQAKLVFQIEEGVIKSIIDNRTSHRVEPTVTTPVESGKEQGTAAEI